MHATLYGDAYGVSADNCIPNIAIRYTSIRSPSPRPTDPNGKNPYNILYRMQNRCWGTSSGPSQTCGASSTASRRRDSRRESTTSSATTATTSATSSPSPLPGKGSRLGSTARPPSGLGRVWERFVAFSAESVGDAVCFVCQPLRTLNTMIMVHAGYWRPKTMARPCRLVWHGRRHCSTGGVVRRPVASATHLHFGVPPTGW